MRIYVGNLPYRLTNDELRGIFEAFGDVSSASLVMDKFTGAPKGFGFVEMPSPEQGRAAVSALQGKQIGGRTLRVDEAHGAGPPGSPGGPARRPRADHLG